MEVLLCKQLDLRATMLGSTNDTLCATHISLWLLSTEEKELPSVVFCVVSDVFKSSWVSTQGKLWSSLRRAKRRKNKRQSVLESVRNGWLEAVSKFLASSYDPQRKKEKCFPRMDNVRGNHMRNRWAWCFALSLSVCTVLLLLSPMCAARIHPMQIQVPWGSFTNSSLHILISSEMQGSFLPLCFCQHYIPLQECPSILYL